MRLMKHVCFALAVLCALLTMFCVWQGLWLSVATFTLLTITTAVNGITAKKLAR